MNPTTAAVIAAWETVVSIARAERDETNNPDLRDQRTRELEALEARLAAIRDPNPIALSSP